LVVVEVADGAIHVFDCQLSRKNPCVLAMAGSVGGVIVVGAVSVGVLPPPLAELFLQACTNKARLTIITNAMLKFLIRLCADTFDNFNTGTAVMIRAFP